MQRPSYATVDRFDDACAGSRNLDARVFPISEKRLSQPDGFPGLNGHYGLQAYRVWSDHGNSVNGTCIADSLLGRAGKRDIEAFPDSDVHWLVSNRPEKARNEAACLIDPEVYKQRTCYKPDRTYCVNCQGRLNCFRHSFPVLNATPDSGGGFESENQ